MDLPFTTEEFLEIFKIYNQSVFPLQIGLVIVAIIIVLFSVKGSNKSDRIIALLMAFLWIYMGIIYHLIFFSAINKVAYVFGSAFVLQGILIFVYGFIKRKLRFIISPGIKGVSGWILIIFSLIVYPGLGLILGHSYPTSPTFGLPCPTTIFTFGIFLWITPRLPLSLLIVPVLWSIIGLSAALNLGMFEDVSLIIAAAYTTFLLVYFKRKERFNKMSAVN